MAISCFTAHFIFCITHAGTLKAIELCSNSSTCFFFSVEGGIKRVAYKISSSSSFYSWLSIRDPSDEISPILAILRDGVAVVKIFYNCQSNTICPPESWSPSSSTSFHFTKHDLLLQAITISSGYVTEVVQLTFDDCIESKYKTVHHLITCLNLYCRS